MLRQWPDLLCCRRRRLRVALNGVANVPVDVATDDASIPAVSRPLPSLLVDELEGGHAGERAVGRVGGWVGEWGG